MLLLAAATDLELKPLADLLGIRDDVDFLLTGVGLVETTLSLTRLLASRQGKAVTRVINFGVAGAFAKTGANLLDICLARSERLADMGICYGDRVEAFDSLNVPITWDADQSMLSNAFTQLQSLDRPCHKGPFVTVNSVSSTEARAAFFWERYEPLCENMEGAAVMRVCQEFGLPCLEIRSVSNFVENRDPAAWKLDDAAGHCARAVSHVLNSYTPKN